ncbi:hypothetical protein PENTCL1PPCAC_7581, partial [Pristionchus entomophagus]
IANQHQFPIVREHPESSLGLVEVLHETSNYVIRQHDESRPRAAEFLQKRHPPSEHWRSSSRRGNPARPRVDPSPVR